MKNKNFSSCAQREVIFNNPTDFQFLNISHFVILLLKIKIYCVIFVLQRPLLVSKRKTTIIKVKFKIYVKMYDQNYLNLIWDYV